LFPALTGTPNQAQSANSPRFKSRIASIPPARAGKVVSLDYSFAAESA
jgi:hypothetical protein